jgi:hypothetical protein
VGVGGTVQMAPTQDADRPRTSIKRLQKIDLDRSAAIIRKTRKRRRATRHRAISPFQRNGKPKLSDVLQDFLHLRCRERAQCLSANVAQF